MEALKPLVTKCEKDKQPPRKGDIMLLKEKCLVLDGRNWLAYKFRVWAEVQKNKRAVEVVKEKLQGATDRQLKRD